MGKTLGHPHTCAMLLCHPVQQRVPALALAPDQFRRLMGPVADEIVLAKTQNGVDHTLAVDRHAIHHRVGQPEQRHGGGDHFIALRLPFLGNGRGQPLGRQHQRVAARCLDRPAIQQHGKAAFRRPDRNVFVKTLHLFFSGFAGNGSRRSSGSKPRSCQLLTICGDKGAVTWSRPPSGRPMSMERACRCSLSAISPRPRASAPPYLKSPTMGVPRLARCTRIWWVRPVMGRAATQANSLPAVPITAYSVMADLASSSSLTVMRSSLPRLPSLASAALITPCFCLGTPRVRA